ncbi:MAG: SBBP repeat-containing protein [Chloroflexi bacterium]|nr:SBBP repeat-containing protein [Chloroflexota bacterium]
MGQTGLTLPGQTSWGGWDAFIIKYNTSGDETWVRQFGTNRTDDAYGLAVDRAGNVYVAGTTFGAFPGQTSSGGNQMFIRLYDAWGNDLWTRQYRDLRYTTVRRLGLDDSGNIFVAGEVGGVLWSQSLDAFVSKYSDQGEPIWVRQFGTETDDLVRGLAVDGSGSVYIGGFTGSALPGQETAPPGISAFVRKYDSLGAEAWTRQFGSGEVIYISAVSTDRANSVYVSGTLWGNLPNMSSPGGSDAFIRKYDGSGNELWTRQFGTRDDDFAEALVVDESGSAYVAGHVRRLLPPWQSPGDYDISVRKYDSLGNELWASQFGTSNNDFSQSVAVDGRANVYVAGTTIGAFPGQSSFGLHDGFAAKLEAIPFNVTPTPMPSQSPAPSPVPLSGDVNRDGVVNLADLHLVAASLNKRSGDPGFNADADINNDGIADIYDLATVGAHFGLTR